MPVYEYRCNDCDREFEKLFLSRSGAEAEVHCPGCGGVEVSRLFSAPAFHRSAEGGSRDVSEEALPEKPPLFGRKELEALKGK